MNKINTKLVTYCGLYCGDCFSYQGKIADLAIDLRKELRQAKFDRLVQGIPFKELKYYPQGHEMLGALEKLRCRKTYLNGGGNPWCKIRLCYRRHEFKDCWQCTEIENCDKLKFLEAGHQDAHLKNLKKIQKSGLEAWLAGKRYY
jgi:hypothetical protein